MGFTIQVGAFSQMDNAVGLEELLENKGLDAYYFLHESGLYKVRFGNYRSYAEARSQAVTLRGRGLIGEFFIVVPEDYSVAKIEQSGCEGVRSELVRTAKRFIGVPYKWGGTSPEKGLDCSGLTLVVYRLNGLNLPRASFHQYDTGKAVAKKELQPGDLVFFATRKPKRVSHVGIYIGEGKFIHAPRRGKDVMISKLSSPYYAKRYMGARTYL
ncbi:MAG: C40 family peptidase [Deltaproteobacteria bacterium]|nr:C40 family peptidase [Deltaproteobacteria bacterium]